MTKKNWLLVSVAVVLAVVYVLFFTDWTKSSTVQVFSTNRTQRTRVQTRQTDRAMPSDGAMPSLNFGLNRQLKLTRIKIVPLADFQTNPSVLPLWNLVSETSSVPIKSFSYGTNISGLKPMVPGTRAQPLVTNVTYRIFVEAGSVKGQHDFELK